MPAVTSTLPALIELCAARFGRAARDLSPDADVFQSLGVDSVQLLSLLSELEQHFGVEIPDYELRDVRTFAQLAACIEQRL
jgi:acyl carrier protein